MIRLNKRLQNFTCFVLLLWSFSYENSRASDASKKKREKANEDVLPLLNLMNTKVQGISKKICNPEVVVSLFSFKYSLIKNNKGNNPELFYFKYNIEYDELDTWPAAEQSPDHMQVKLLQKAPQGEFDQLMAFLKSFGFDINTKDREITVPTFEFLIKRWNEEVKDLGISLGELEFILHDGIASDQEFYTYFINKKVIVSRGKEFLHDMTLHVLPVLLSLYTIKRNQKSKEEVDFFVNFTRRHVKNLINNLKKYIAHNNFSKEEQDILWMQLSFMVDNLATQSLTTFTIHDIFPGLVFKSYRDSFTTTAYFKKRFGRDVQKMDFDKAHENWTKIISSN